MLFTKDLVLSVYFSVCLTSNKLYWIEDQLANVSTRFYTLTSWHWRVEPLASWLDTQWWSGSKEKKYIWKWNDKKNIYNISKIWFYTLTSLEFLKSKSEDKKLYKLVNVTKTYKCMVGKSMVTFFEGRIICFTGIH